MNKILIAEDNPDFRQIVVDVVREKFKTADIWTAKDGKEALQKFRAWGRDVDAVITDLMMPKMQGDVLATYIREGVGDENYDVPIILLSSEPEMVKDYSLFNGVFRKDQIYAAVDFLNGHFHNLKGNA